MVNRINIGKLKKSELEDIVGQELSNEDFQHIQDVCRQYPAIITSQIAKLAQHPEIAKQYIPDKSELEMKVEDKKPFRGKIETGISGTERMYESEMIVIASTNCAANCRACVRKNYLQNPEEVIREHDLDRLIDYVNKEGIQEVLITGGDPLTNPEHTLRIINALSKSFVKHIRIGTALLRADPERISGDFIDRLKSYNRSPNYIEISPHFDHPLEFTEKTKEKIQRLKEAGFTLYVQTILLKGVNDKEETLMQLAGQIRDNGMEWHYLYHCLPVDGNLHLRTSVERGIQLVESFETHSKSTGRHPPKNYVIASTIGKVYVNPTRIVEREGDYLWIETRYMPENYLGNKLPDCCKVGKKGYLLVKYLDGNDQSQTPFVNTLKRVSHFPNLGNPLSRRKK